MNKQIVNGNSYALHHVVDDLSIRQIKALDLGQEATMHHHYKMLAIMLQQGALAQLFKGACRSSFVINKKNARALAYKDVHSQLGFALNIWRVTNGK